MKSYISNILVSIIIMQVSVAQDVIYKNDGSEIKSKIVEIENEFVKYRNYSQPEGPLRYINKSEIFLIIYQDGSVEKFEETKINNQNNKLSPYCPKENDISYVNAKLKTAYKVKNVGMALIIGGTIGALIGGLNVISGDGSQGYLLIIGSATWLTGGIMRISADSGIKHWRKRQQELSIFIHPEIKNFNNSSKLNNALLFGFKVSF